MNVETGRFISQDSYEGNRNDPLSLHKYLYANADSVNGIDPSGRSTIMEQTGVVNGINIGATYSYAPLSTVSKVALAEFAAETAIVTAETTTTATSTILATLPSILAFAGAVTIGTILEEAGKPKEDEDEYEVFYRAMSETEYSRLQTSGELAVKPNRTELFVTRSFDYAYWFSRTRTGHEIIVAFVMDTGTEDALISRGAVSASAVQINPSLGTLPHISSYRQGEPNVVHLKGERGSLTFGLGHGTVGEFNSRIVAYKGFSQ